jgi:cell division protein FtsX
MDGFNRRIFSYYFVFYSIFIGYLICVLVVLMLKVYMAVVRVKLEPYLEFLHSARA